MNSSKMEISALIKYPIKSLPGISVEASDISKWGLSLDRRILILQENGLPITQREYPKLALLQCNLDDGHFSVRANGTGEIRIPLGSGHGEVRNVQLWKARRTGTQMDPVFDDFFRPVIERRV